MSSEGSTNNSIIAALMCAGLMAGLWGAAIYFAPVRPFPITTGVLFVALGVICWFDFDHFRIPDWITFPLIGVGLLMAMLFPSPPFVWRLAAALAGYGLIWALNAYWKTYRGRDGIGMGDAKLLAAAGAWLGVALLPIVTLVASVLALIWIFAVQFRQAEASPAGRAFPFGPFLSIGFFTVWVFKSSLRLYY